MENIIKDFKKSRLFVLYILGFIFAFTSAIPAYVNSSFLKNLTNEHVIGFIYIIGAIINLCALMIIPKILKRFGNYRVTLFSTILYFFSFIGIVFFQNIFLVLFCFVMTGMMASIIYFNLDVFIEHDSLNNEVGGIRGIYLTCINLAWLFSPWIAGEIVGIS